MAGHGAHSHKKKMGEIAPGVLPRCQNVFRFLSSMQRGLLATYPAPISTVFEITDVNPACVQYTGEKFFNFCTGFSRSPKQPKCSTLGRGVCDRAAAQMAQLWVLEIILQASWHPKDVSFVCEFWWGTYGLGAISPRKSPNFCDFTTWSDLIV